MESGKTLGLYLIGVVAETLEMHPQTLRKYEQAGFLTPQRMGSLRLYSHEDLERLRVIKHFVEGLGLNIAGVALALNVTAQLLALRARVRAIEQPSESDRETLADVDRILGEMGLCVAEESKSGEQKELPPPQMPSFEFRPGEVLRIV